MATMKSDTQLTITLKNAIGREELAAMRLFADADLDAIAGLLRACPVYTLRKDEVLIVPGIVNQRLFLVVRGRLRVHLESLETDPIQIIETGEAAGEISLIDEKPATAYVVADSAANVISIDNDTFWALVNLAPVIAHNMLIMVVERVRANNALISEGMRLREQYHRQTKVDDLTGLRNKKAFEELLRRQLMRSSMGERPMSLMLVDIDDLSQYNADFGAGASDNALVAVAQTLQDQVRPTDLVARIANGTFAVILPDTNSTNARIAAARLCAAVAEAVVVMADESILPSVTVSIGIADRTQADKAEELITAAEKALEQSKTTGPGSFSD